MFQNHFLSQVFTSEEFTSGELELIIPKYKSVEFGKNSYLLKEKEIANKYWFIETGFVRSYALDKEGNDISTNFFSRRNIVIDWPSFLLQKPRKKMFRL